MLKKLLSVAIVAASMNVNADVLSYNNVSIGYSVSDIDGVDFSGFGVAGQFSVTDVIFVSAGYASQSSDEKFLGSDIDLSGYDIGIGFRHPLSPQTHLVGESSRADVELEFAGESADTDATSLDLGIRHAFADNLEAGISLTYLDGEEDNDQYANIGARYFVNQQFALGATTTIGQDDVDTYSLELTLTF